MGRVTTRRPVARVSPRGVVRRPDTLAVEEPLEIRVAGTPLVVTMRTPGDDVDLAHGFLLAEGIIGARSDVVSAIHCAGEGENTYNVLDVALAPGIPLPESRRNFLANSSCGVCGKAALEDVTQKTRWPLTPADDPVETALLGSLPDKLRAEQRVFEATGGLHAAALCGLNGELLAVREDVGRHNAVDKVIGWAVREDRLPLSDVILVVSGRASFELVQKAVMAGIPVLGAVSAPSSLAVDLAVETGLTLVGFLRGETMNVYSHPGRLAL
jgi:FdhD protein